jgi:hypothetical protein
MLDQIWAATLPQPAAGWQSFGAIGLLSQKILAAPLVSAICFWHGPTYRTVLLTISWAPSLAQAS